MNWWMALEQLSHAGRITEAELHAHLRYDREFDAWYRERETVRLTRRR